MLVLSVFSQVQRKLSIRTSKVVPFFVRASCHFSYPITRTETFDQHSLSDEWLFQCQSEHGASFVFGAW